VLGEILAAHDFKAKSLLIKLLGFLQVQYPDAGMDHLIGHVHPFLF
jgi:hypothetical protein